MSNRIDGGFRSRRSFPKSGSSYRSSTSSTAQRELSCTATDASTTKVSLSFVLRD